MMLRYTTVFLLAMLFCNHPAVAQNDGFFCIKNNYLGQYLSDGPAKLADTCDATEIWQFEQTSPASGYCIKNQATGNYLSDIHPQTYSSCSTGELWQLEPINVTEGVAVNISANVDTFGQTLFGVTGVQPLVASFNIDPEAVAVVMPRSASNPDFVSDLYGYAAADITDFSLQIGNRVFTVEHLLERIPAVGYSADVWFDASIDNPSAISKVWFLVADNEGDADVGGAGCYATYCDLGNQIYVTETGSNYGFGDGTLLLQVTQ